MPSEGQMLARESVLQSVLQYLTDFNSSISQAMEHLSDFVFVTFFAYLSHLKSGIKPDTLAALRTAPLQMTTLFPDEVLKQAEQDIATFESKNQSPSSKKSRFHPYERTDKRSDNRLSCLEESRTSWSGQERQGTLHDQPRGSSHTNDNQCVISPVQGLLPGSIKTVKHVQFTQSPSCTRKTLNSQTQDSLSVS